jgi:omega-6 fatty acid desaturase (delta-12 desaturase)
MADPASVNPYASAPSTFHPPTYTMKEIYAAIPPHCFHPNTFISLAYVLRDLLFALILALLASQIPNHISHPLLRVLAWAAYSFCQGLVFTGLWEIAHETGHGALSKHRWVNHAIGLPIHSALLTPYHSWRFTHQTHHKHTNHLEKDIAFVPDTKSQHESARAGNPFAALPFWDLAEDTPVVALVTLFFHQLIAFPVYLTLNNFAIERMRVIAWWKRSHFYFGGDGPNFRPIHCKEILISDLGIAVWGVVLSMVGSRWGWQTVWAYYGVPYLWTNHWICEFWNVFVETWLFVSCMGKLGLWMRADVW